VFQASVANPVAGLHAQALEGVRQLLDARIGVAPGVAVDRSLDRAGDDLGVAVVEGGVLDELRNQKRAILHESEHRGVSPVVSSGGWAPIALGSGGHSLGEN
jgi:hypothetical protein